MRSSLRGGLRARLASGLCGVLLGCGVPTQAPSADAARERAAAPAASPRLHALLINGGGRPRINYHSHLEHLRRLVALLEAAGVPPHRIAVFSADGDDPAADLAMRDGEGRDEDWLLPRDVARSLRPVVYADSRIEGVTLRAATRSSLGRWFAEVGSRLGAGDELLLYVTDHGERGGDEPTDNSVTLWGESIDVEALRALLAQLGPGTRVVLVMSQCYSGGFAHLIRPPADAATSALDLCGYFSTTASRPAHGCYPEVSGRAAVGYSHRLFEALGAGLGLAEAQRELLVSDDTPDVPNSTRGLFLEMRLEAVAGAAGVPLPTLADSLLEEALEQPLVFEPELRLLDRVAGRYGFASPRSLATLEAQAGELEDLSERLATWAALWDEAFETLRQENLKALRAAQPAWASRLAADALRGLDDEARRRTRRELSEALERTAADSDRLARMHELRRKADGAGAARHRAEVRLAVVLRMRALLLEIAARHELATRGGPRPRRDLARLEACENLALAPPAETPRRPPAAEPFPSLAEERRRLAALVPGWLGIHYRPLGTAERRGRELPEGAARVSTVLPGTPASEAGIEAGDVLLGTPDAGFAERDAIRAWTLLGEVGRSHPLRLLRDGEEREVRVRLAARPLELPELPGPPELGSAAPALELELLDGAALPAPGEAHLLFFWASWCAFCKAALPEVAAFAASRRIPVVAITDETPEEAAAFLRREPEARRLRVASDRRRRSFERYGVSGTPTFVFVDAEGIVRRFQQGYDARRGLALEGWHFERPDPTP